MAERSNRRDVRNPILALPAAQRMQKMPPLFREQLRALMLDLKKDAQARATECWRKHKAPMACYWEGRRSLCGAHRQGACVMRALLPIALAGLVLHLGNALAAHAWLVSLPLIVILASGIALLACDATPGASALPAPADTTEDSVSATGARR